MWKSAIHVLSLIRIIVLKGISEMDTFGGPPTDGEFTFLIGFAAFLVGVLVGGGGLLLAQRLAL